MIIGGENQFSERLLLERFRFSTSVLRVFNSRSCGFVSVQSESFPKIFKESIHDYCV